MSGLSMSVSFNEIQDIITEDLKELELEVLEELKTRLQQKTPIKTGEAQAGWKIEGNQVINDVEYIGYLETGTIHHRPIGMVATTVKEIDTIVSKVINKIN